MKQTLGEIGEKRLLERLQRFLGHSPSIIRIFSEDCAVLRGAPGQYRLFTTDVLVRNIHFRCDYADARTIGRKAVLINLSDISAMGGTPSFFMLSAGFEKDTSIQFVEELYEGMTSAAGEAGITLAGGNMSQSPTMFLDIFMGGEVAADEALFRNGAGPGDALFVSSQLGASSAGLRCLEAGYRLGKIESPAIREAIQAHVEPPNHNPLARKLASWKLLSSMIDLSDGLASDLAELCRESGIGARLELNRIPVAGCVKELAASMNWNPQELALYGGEDYHLLFTVPSQNKVELLRRTSADNISVYEIGLLTESSQGICALGSNGELIPLKQGFEHFQDAK